MKMRLKILLSVFFLTFGSLAYCGEVQDLVIADDIAKLKALFQANPALVNEKDTNGWTPLHYAINLHQKDIIQLLLDDHADVSIQQAAAIGDSARVNALLKADPRLVNSKDPAGCTALHYAIFLGHKSVVELLLANKAHVNGEQGSGNTPLLEAAWRGDPNIAELLLTNNADVNAKNEEGYTPLHTAALMGEAGVAKLLIANGADVNARANDGETPLHSAGRSLHGEDVAKLLLANGANINAKDSKGETPLNLAIICGQTNLARFLRQRGGEATTPANSTTLRQSTNISKADIKAVLDPVGKTR